MHHFTCARDKQVYENPQIVLEEDSSNAESTGSEEEVSNNLSTHSGMILASAILSDSSFLDDFKDKYLVIFDQAIASLKFDKLNKAINVMAEKG